MDRGGLNRNKWTDQKIIKPMWTERTVEDQSRQNEPDWTIVDQIGPKSIEQTVLDQIRPIRTEVGLIRPKQNELD